MTEISNNFSILKFQDLDVNNPGIRDGEKGPGFRIPGLLSITVASRHLWSADIRCLLVPRTTTVFGINKAT